MQRRAKRQSGQRASTRANSATNAEFNAWRSHTVAKTKSCASRPPPPNAVAEELILNPAAESCESHQSPGCTVKCKGRPIKSGPYASGTTEIEKNANRRVLLQRFASTAPTRSVGICSITSAQLTGAENVVKSSGFHR